MRILVTSILISLLLLACGDASVKEYTLEVQAEYPHDTESYTQGLFIRDGQMYESTGVHGKSTFRKVDLQTGKPLEKLEFDKKYFVEGSVMWKDNLYILTWESRVAFIYDANTLEYKSTWKYPREGWVSPLTESISSLPTVRPTSILWMRISLRKRRCW